MARTSRCGGFDLRSQKAVLRRCIYAVEPLELRVLLAIAPSSAEFRVNTNTTDIQSTPSAAMAGDGSSIVVWQSNNQDGGGYGVYAQRYAASGEALGGEFRVNTTTANNQTVPSVAMDLAGDYLISWQSELQDGDSSGIYARRYNAGTGILGSEFRVNTTTSGAQANPSVAMDLAGDSVVVWTSVGQIYAQLYDPSGAAVGGEFRVNTNTFSTQSNPQVAIDSKGDFVVAWDSSSSSGHSAGIYGQRFDAMGVAQGAEISLSSSQSAPALAMDAVGNFAMTSAPSFNSGQFTVRRYSADGTLAWSHSANLAGGTATSPRMVMGPTGDLSVIWQGPGADSNTSTAMLSRFNADGTSVSHDMQLNTNTAPSLPAIARSLAGDLLVCWGLSTGTSDIYARRYMHFDHAATVGDRVWTDSNGDGIQDPGEGSPSSVRVKLFTAAGLLVDATTSQFGGAFSFVDLQPGVSYYMQASPAVGTGLDSALQGDNRDLDNDLDPITGKTANFMLGPDQVDMTRDIGFLQSSMSGVVFNDLNGDGVRQAGEPALAGWKVSLDGVSNGTAIHQMVTSATNYSFSGLGLGTFNISLQMQDGWTATTPTSATFSRPPQAVPFVSFGVHTAIADPQAPAFAPETRVNTFTANDQTTPALAANAGGDAVAVWVSSAQDGSFTGIYGQRMDSQGNRRGGEFRISTSTDGDQREPSVAMDAAGNFVVAWSGKNASGTYDVRARRFDVTGTPLGGEVNATQTALASQAEPSIAMNSTGDFAVVWSDSTGATVTARFFGADGSPAGDAFAANAGSSGHGRPSAAMDGSGRLIVAWCSAKFMVRRFAPDGSILGSDAAMDYPNSSFETTSAVGTAVAPDGRFAVVMQTSASKLYELRFSNAGLPQGDPLRVGATSNATTQPVIAVAADGTYQIAWSEQVSPNGAEIRVQRFSAAGIATSTAVGNALLSGDQTSPAIAADGNGHILLAWATQPTVTATGSDIMVSYSPLVWTSASVGGFVWNDDNGDGIRQSSETGMSGVSVKLFDASNTLVQSATTSSTGTYRFDGLLPGASYYVQFTKPGGYLFALQNAGTDDTLDSDVERVLGNSPVFTPTSGQVDLTVCAGFASPSTITPQLFLDVNNNGVKDAGEAPIPSATVFLDMNVNGVADPGEPSGLTDATGRYTFASLDPGVYTLVIGSRPHLTPVKSVWSASPAPSGGVVPLPVAMSSDVPLTVAVPTAPMAHFGNYTVEADGRIAVLAAPSGNFWALYLTGTNLLLMQHSADGQLLSWRLLDTMYIASVGYCSPSLSGSPSGDFVAAWVNTSAGPSVVKAQRFDATGAPKGAAFTVSQSPNVLVRDEQVVVGAAGDFAITWVEGSTNPVNVRVRRYSASGVAGSIFTPGTAAQQNSPQIAIDADDNILLAWSDLGSDGQWRTTAQRFGPNSAAIGPSFRPGGDTLSIGSSPRLTIAANGESMICWLTATGSEAQWYDAAGVAEGGPVTNIYGQSLASNGHSLFYTAGREQWYLAGGIPVGGTVPVTSGGEYFSSISSFPDGRLLYAWSTSTGSEIGGFYEQILTTTPPPPGASLAGVAWSDDNGDGIRDAGEPGWAGVAINIFKTDNVQVGSATTAADGTWRVDNLPAGLMYRVSATLPSGSFVTPADQGSDDSIDCDFDSQGSAIVVAPGSGGADLSLGLGLVKRASISGEIYLDANSNGAADAGEGLSGWTAYLDSNGNGGLDPGEATVSTLSDGKYSFTGLMPGPVRIGFVPHAGFDAVAPINRTLTSGEAAFDYTAAHTSAGPFLVGPASDALTLPGLSFPQSFWGELPGVAVNSKGGVVAWAGGETVAALYHIYAQKLDLSGQAVGPTITIADISDPTRVGVAMDAGSNFVVVWGDRAGRILAQRCDSQGNKVGSLMVLAQGLAAYPSIAMDGSGNFAVCWQGTGSPPSLTAVLYSPTGTLLHSFAAGAGAAAGDTFARPSIAMDGAGDAAIVWASDSSSTFSLQRFASDGTSLGVPVRVNGQDYNSSVFPAVAMNRFGQLGLGARGVGIDDMGNFAVASSIRTFNAAGIRQDSLGGADALAMRPDGSFIIAVGGGTHVLVQAFEPYTHPASLSGVAWADADGDGIRSPGETPLANVTVNLQSATGWVYANTQTDSNGAYHFDHLEPGYPYIVKISTPSGLFLDVPGAGGDPTADNDFAASDGTYAATLVADENRSHIDAGFAPPSSISGVVFDDRSGDGQRQAAEPGIGLIRVYVDSNNDGQLSEGETSATTNSTTGTFTLSPLRSGNWTVRAMPGSSYVSGGPDPIVSVGVAQVLTGLAIPLDRAAPDPTKASVSGLVWDDLNGDGIRQPGEPGTSSATVTLLTSAGATVATTTTNNSALLPGAYRFDTLTPGTAYQIKITVTGKTATLLGAGADRSVDSDIDPATLKASFTAPASGAADAEVDAGFLTTASIAGTVFFDANGDGIRQGPESLLSGWMVYADLNTNGVLDPGEPSANTNTSGAFTVSGINPGAVTLVVSRPSWVVTTPSSLSITVLGGQAVTGVAIGVRTEDPAFVLNTTGSERTANVTIGSNTPTVSVASDAAGNFVAVWSDATGGVTARRFDAQGNPIGGEIPVNTTLRSSYYSARVAMNASGSFVVVWNRAATFSGKTPGVFAQLFDPQGQKIGGEINVSSTSTPKESDPDVAMDASGVFTVTWSCSTPPATIMVRRFSASATPLGPEFAANLSGASDASGSAIAMDASGNFTVTWDSLRRAGATGWQVYARRFDSGGNPLGADFHVGSTTSTSNTSPIVAESPSGQYAIAWKNGNTLMLQRFTPAGIPATAELSLGTSQIVVPDNRALALDDQGNMTLATAFNVTSVSYAGVQRITPAGLTLGTAFPVGLINGSGSSPWVGALCVRSSGDAVMVWPGYPAGTKNTPAVKYAIVGVPFLPLAVAEDSGPQSIANAALTWRAGASNYTVTTDHPEFFSGAPAISSTGTLTFTPLPNANGLVTLSVTSDGLTQTLQLQITAVNDPPAINPVPVQDVSPGTSYVIPLSGISPGPDAGQSVTLTATASNPAFFSSLSVTASGASGALSFQTAPDAHGDAVILLTLQDDGGGPGKGTTVLPVNVAVTATDSTPPTAAIVGAGDGAIGTPSVQISFSEPVLHFIPSTLSLTRDGTNVALSPVLLTQRDATTWLLSGLSSLTSTAGHYALGFKDNSGVTDAAGNPLSADPVVSWTVGSVLAIGGTGLAVPPGGTLHLVRDVLSPDLLDVFTSASLQPLAQASASTLQRISIDASALNQTILDESSGEVIPAGGIDIAGKAGNGTSLAIAGISTADAFTLNANSISHVGAAVTFSGIDALALGQGAFTAASSLAGLWLSLASAAQLTLGTNQLLGGLAIDPGGFLDLVDHSVAVGYSGPSPESTLQQYFQSGRLIASQSTNTSFSRFGRTLAIFDNHDAHVSSLDGQPLSPDYNQVLVKYTYLGDANADGRVDPTDYAIVDGKQGIGHSWITGDLNFDGKVDPTDYAQIDGNQGAGYGGAGGPQLDLVGTAPQLPDPLGDTPARLSSDPVQDPPSPPKEEDQPPAAPPTTGFSTKPITGEDANLLGEVSPSVL